MRAAVWQRPGELEIEERPDPEAGPDEIVVRVGACEGTSARTGALVEPLACAVHGMRRLAPETGDSVLVTGAGTMGLLLLQLLGQGGAANVVVVDRNERRLELARSLGASRVEADVEAAVGEHSDGFDCVVDATGVPIQTEPLLTHTFPLDRFEDALASMRAGEGLKVQVLPNS